MLVLHQPWSRYRDFDVSPLSRLESTWPPSMPTDSFSPFFVRLLVRPWDYSRPIKFNEFPRVPTALLVSLITHALLSTARFPPKRRHVRPMRILQATVVHCRLCNTRITFMYNVVADNVNKSSNEIDLCIWNCAFKKLERSN